MIRSCHPLRATRRLLLATLGLLVLGLAPVAALPIRVVTYNLHGMSPGSNWQVRMVFIVQRLIELDPDLICLEEVCETIGGGGADNQARTIAEELGQHFGQDYTWTFQQTHIGWEQFNEGIAIVSKLPVTESGYRQLASGTFPRKCVWNRVEAEGGALQVFVTHLEHTSSGGAVRLLQATQARNYVLEKLADFPGSAAVLGGDFNCTPTSAPIRLYTEGGPDSLFCDAWAALHSGENGFTMPAEAPTQRIDYLFSIAPNGPWTPDSSRVVLTQRYDSSHYLSDHFGVLAVYEQGEQNLDPPHPLAARLRPPWPNPFNPETRVELSLPAATSRLRLGVHDLLGRQVALLHDGPLAAGVHAFDWQPTHTAAGLYLIRLTDESGRSETRRALYLP